MVTVVDYKERSSDEYGEFFVLVVQDGVQIVKSRSSGNPYFTSKRATVPTTFDEEQCKSLIGHEFPGRIETEECETYEYYSEETGESIMLNHRNVYVDEEITTENSALIAEEEVM